MICMCVQEKTAIKDMNKKKIYSLMSYYVKFPLLYTKLHFEELNTFHNFDQNWALYFNQMNEL